MLTSRHCRLSLLAGFCLLFLTATPVHAGAWGHQSFANDDALDWIENDLRPGGMRAVERAVVRIATAKGYIEAPECCDAIAACEVLAAANGKPAPDLPKDVTAIANKLEKPREEMLKTARAALDKIVAKSELRELWAESRSFEAWKKSVAELKARL